MIQEYNKRYEFFRDITGEAMRVHRKYKPGLLESAYEAALKYQEKRPLFFLIYVHELLYTQYF